MKSIHDLEGMPLVTVNEGTRLGTLDAVDIDTVEGRIRYLHFKGESRTDGVVSWESVRALGGDAITVDTVESVRAAVPALHRGEVTSLAGDRAVVTEGGTRIGLVTGYDIDEATGRVEKYRVATGGFFGRLVNAELTFARSAVRALGGDAIIVADEAYRSVLGVGV